MIGLVIGLVPIVMSPVKVLFNNIRSDMDYAVLSVLFFFLFLKSCLALDGNEADKLKDICRGQ